MTRARDVANLIGSGNYSSTTFTATAGQTAFTISHTQGFVQVFMNGLLLDETVDYTSNGSAITLTSGAAAGDEIEVVKYNTFSVGDAIPASGGTFTGDVGIGTTPDSTLTMSDTVPIIKLIDSDDNTFSRVYHSAGKLLFDADKGNTGSGSTINFGIDDTERMLITTDKVQFNVDAKVNTDNSHDLGSGGARWKDLYLSGGAYIGGTGASNKLEDYEEGTHTLSPTGGSNVTLHSTYVVRPYTKVGRIVTMSIYVQVTSESGSDPFRLSLPFTAASSPSNGTNTSSGGVMAENINVGSAGLQYYINSGANEMRFYRINNDDSAWDELRNSDLQRNSANSALYCTVVYQAA